MADDLVEPLKAKAQSLRAMRRMDPALNFDETAALLDKAADRISDLTRELEEARDVIEFYANPETYFAVSFIGDPPCGEFVEDISETHLGWKPGRRARAFLERDESSLAGQPSERAAER